MTGTGFWFLVGVGFGLVVLGAATVVRYAFEEAAELDRRLELEAAERLVMRGEITEDQFWQVVGPDMWRAPRPDTPVYLDGARIQ